MPSAVTRDSSFSQALEDVNKAAQDDTLGTGRAHYSLLESIQKLTLAAEKPSETLQRFRFEVGQLNWSFLSTRVRAMLASKYMLIQITSLAVAECCRENGHRGWSAASHRRKQRQINHGGSFVKGVGIR